jgi:AcrR family transcriptional regulator
VTSDTVSSRPFGASPAATVEDRVLLAVRECCERYGSAKVTIDDIAAAARVSRATIYRMFPGGKDVLFEALRVRELEEFFADLERAVEGASSLHELLVRTVVTATRRLRDDEHLALMLAAEPGEVLSQLTSAGVPRIVRFATTFLVPLLDPFLDRAEARTVIDVLSRLTISYFLAPSDAVDLGRYESAAAFLAPFIDVLTSTGGHHQPALSRTERTCEP